MTMKQRIITALVAICLLIPVLIFSDTPALPIMLALCSVIGVYEMSGCLNMKKAWTLVAPLYAVAAGAPFAVRYLFDTPEQVRQVLSFALGIGLIWFFAVLTFCHGKWKTADISALFMTSLYIIFGFNAILMIRDYEIGGKYLYLTVFIGAWVSDTFAYFCGMLLGRGGKHKLIPDVSPKKTVEGAVGAIVFTAIAMVVFGLVVGQLAPEFTVNYLLLAVGGILISVVAQIGDLFLSVIKRNYGIKDYGKLFPGHGGVLDRFDSILAVAVLLAAFCSYFNLFEVL